MFNKIFSNGLTRKKSVFQGYCLGLSNMDSLGTLFQGPSKKRRLLENIFSKIIIFQKIFFSGANMGGFVENQ